MKDYLVKVKAFNYKLFYGVNYKEIQDELDDKAQDGYHLVSTESYISDGMLVVVLFLEREI